jgi:hypothetical protein
MLNAKPFAASCVVSSCLVGSLCLVGCVRAYMSSADQGVEGQDATSDALGDSISGDTSADAPLSDGEAADAVTDAAVTDAALACSYGTGHWRLGPVERVAEVSSSGWEGNTWVTADGLTLYLSSGRSGTIGRGDIWKATRAGSDVPFTEPVNMAALNSTEQEDGLTISDDGLAAVLCSNRGDPGGPTVIWSATRGSPSEAWAADLFVKEPNLPQDPSVYDAELSGDGLRLYYSWWREGVEQQIFMAQRPSRSAPFGPGVEVDGVNSEQSDADPTLSPNERVIIIVSTRPGGLGGTDLWYATRSDRGSAFSAPLPMPGLNSDSLDGEAFLSADGCDLYFSSYRAGGSGSADIYRVRVIAGP